MSNGFNTEISTMDTAAGRVDQVNQDIATLLRTVQDRVQELGGAWRGQAQASFTQIMTNWDTESRNLNDALAGIAESLRRNSSQFDAAEQDNAAALQRVAGSGPLNMN